MRLFFNYRNSKEQHIKNPTFLVGFFLFVCLDWNLPDFYDQQESNLIFVWEVLAAGLTYSKPTSVIIFGVLRIQRDI